MISWYDFELQMRLPGEVQEGYTDNWICDGENYFTYCLSGHPGPRLLMGNDRWNHDRFNLCRDCI